MDRSIDVELRPVAMIPNLSRVFRNLWLLTFLCCAALNASAIPPKTATGSTAPKFSGLGSILPATFAGTWEVQACRRGAKTADGTFGMNINARRRVSGWFTNANESELRVRGLISRRGLVTARVQGHLILRAVVTGTTNAIIQGIIGQRCAGILESFRPIITIFTNQPPDTNVCCNPTNQPVLFPDTNFAAYVSSLLGKPVEQIQPMDLLSITRIELPYLSGVRDLTGLQYATNAYLVLLQGNPQITNYSALYHLPNLHYLYLSQVTNCAFVTNLTLLEHLDIRDSAIGDAAQFLPLTNLYELVLSETYATNIAALVSLPRLSWLIHSDPGITDATPYGALTQLSDLNLRGSFLDLAPLSSLTNLIAIWLGGSPLTNFGALRTMSHLGYAHITDAGMPDLDWLHATNIYSLYLDGNLLTNVSPLAGLPHLSALDLSRNPISDLSPLRQLPHLTSLQVDQVGLRDLSCVTNLHGLFYLSARNNLIADLDPLENCTNITYLHLNDNQITNIAGLASLPNLNGLYLGSNHITDLSPLAGCTSLSSLDANDNQITSLSPLTGCTNLSSLDVGHNQIPSIDALTSLTRLSDLDLGGNAITNISPLLGLTNLWFVTLYGNPLDFGAGTEASNVVQTLRDRGVWVFR